MSLLRLEPQYSESSADFALEKYELLRQVRKEQAREECTWSTCPLVTTIMFNVAVDASTNTSFKLRQRSYSTIVAKLKIIADNNTTAVNVPTHAVNAITTESGSTDCNISASAKAAVKESQCARKLFTFDRSRPEVSGTNANEQAFQIQLFTTLRASKLFTSKKKLFVRVYHFAGCICDGIWPKSEHDLLLRWGAMKRADNRSSSLKIKLRVPSNTFAQSKMQQESRSNSTTDSAGTLASSGSAHPAQSGSNSNLGVCSAEPGTGNQPSQSRPTEPDAEIMVVPAAPNPASNDDRQNTTISPVSLQSNASIGNEQGIDTAPQSSFILEQLPTMISEQDMEYFRTLAKSIKQVPGKWGYLHKCFLERYPESQLSANALRCRLKEQRKRKSSAMEPVRLPPSSAGKERRATSCPSCQKKRKRCGDTSVNPTCLRAGKVRSLPLDAYFSSSLPH